MQSSEEKRRRRLVLNTTSSIIYQLTSVVSGFVLPRLILQTFGSDVNGLVNSITQFLSIVAFLELGVGTVVQSALYKPLAMEDDEKVNQIVTSAGKFFNTLAAIILAYVCVLLFAYPVFVRDDFGWFYTATLIAAISISSFAQYYFGVVDRILLTADQHGYIQFNAQTVTLIVNTAACALLIEAGASIQTVKLTTSLIYLMRPLFLRYYVRHHYQINRHAAYGEEPIPQKWNGVAQHVASVVLDNTDNIVLTIFSTLANVSIYSVYFLVVYGIKQLFMSMVNGFQSLLGELWARQEREELTRTFGWFEWLVHSGVVLVFGCTGMLIVPFVLTYTAGITDANYNQPLFGILLTCANAFHCLRLPYNVMILSAGHYRQTQSNYIVAVVLNLTISIAAVQWFGLVGVTVGTLVAMMYQTIWMVWYDSRNIVKWPIGRAAKQFSVDALVAVLASLASSQFKMGSAGYLAWGVLAIKTLVVWLLVFLLVNGIFYPDRLKRLAGSLSKKRDKV